MLDIRFICALQREFWNYVKPIKASMWKLVNLWQPCGRFQKNTHQFFPRYRIRYLSFFSFMEIFVSSDWFMFYRLVCLHSVCFVLIFCRYSLGSSMQFQRYKGGTNWQSWSGFIWTVSYYFLNICILCKYHPVPLCHCQYC